jgi:diguanylate cyclase (GGDEF)-like protein/PAS domain S-box-containing protein
LGLWEHSQAGLLHGDSAMGLPGTNSTEVITLFARIQPHYEAIVGAAKALVSSSRDTAALAQSIRTLRAHESEFLNGMDDIVFRYDREANEKVESTRWLEIGLMCLTLLVLALEAAFIFAPTTRRIQRGMRELADREEDLELLFSVSPTALLLVSSGDLTILHANRAAADLMGLAVEALVARNLSDHLAGDPAAIQGFLQKIARGEGLDGHEVLLRGCRDSIIDASISVRAIHFSGQAVSVLGITDITDQKQRAAHLEEIAHHDSLTHLPNRLLLRDRLRQAMAQNQRTGTQLAVCYLDLDGFKEVNDRLGHQAGDHVLVQVAHRLESCVRGGDTVARLGGDEFIVLLLGLASEDECRLALERLLKRIAQPYLIDGGKQANISASVGVTLFPADPVDPDALVRHADHAMYAAKQAGRNRYRRFDPAAPC